VSEVLAASGDISHLDYFEERLTNVSLFKVFNFYDAYYELMSSLDGAAKVERAKGLRDIATSSNHNIFYKYAATSTISALREDLRSIAPEQANALSEMISEIKAGETNALLQQRYESF